MNNPDKVQLRDLLDRVSRLVAAGEWGEGLNPAQHSVLSYLARANRFSRTPSSVAEFMCTTRGTTSQTLKALETKGMIDAVRSNTDRRSIAYRVTRKGREVATSSGDLDMAIHALSSRDRRVLQMSLEALVRSVLHQRGSRSFGLCRTCRFHVKSKTGRTCDLLKVKLTDEEANEVCFEHEPAPDTVVSKE